MRTFAIVAALAASVAAQGVTSAIGPPAAAPSGCRTTVPGTFHISYVNVSSTPKRDLDNTKRQLDGLLTLKLDNGLLTDQAGRTGYIASNFQFQFDQPPQAGSIYTTGWSVCPNNTLALGGSAIFYKCLTGNFYNLYDRHWAAQCDAIYLNTDAAAGGSTPSASVTRSTTSSASLPSSTASQTTNGPSSFPTTSTSNSTSQTRSTTLAPPSSTPAGSATSSSVPGAAATAVVLGAVPALAAGLLGVVALF